MKIGEYFKGVRLRRDMSLREAAKAAGISHIYLRDIENGEVENPSFFKVIALLNAYHLSVGELVGDLGIEVKMGYYDAITLMLNKKTEVIQFRVTSEMKQKLRTLSKERNMTVAAIIEDALVRKLFGEEI